MRLERCTTFIANITSRPDKAPWDDSAPISDNLRRQRGYGVIFDNRPEPLPNQILRADSIEEYLAIIPSKILRMLGGGKSGEDRAKGLLIGLSAFAPEPATFARDAFNAVAAVDYETQVPLELEDSRALLDAALKLGFLKRADTKEERYTSNHAIGKVAEKLFKD